MKARQRFSRIVAAIAGAAGVLWLSGCGNLFIAKHKVLVDAISAPGMVKPAGQSYRLVAKKAVVSQGQGQVPVIKACIDAALSTQGRFEPPPTVAPDIFIEVGYGTDTAGRVDPAARETYLQLSARSNPDKSPDRATGPEIWDVRVAVLGVAGRIETAMPLLSAVAANYMATDTHMETKIDIPQNSPMVGNVRETAIKALEAKAAGAPAPSNAAPANGAAPVGAEATNAQNGTADTAAAAAARAAVTPVK
jgi:hypothetical protein